MSESAAILPFEFARDLLIMNNSDKHSILRRPFASIPNPEFLYSTGSMERVLQETSRCIERIEGIACIVGNSGLGKSMACQALFERFRTLMHVVHLNSARLCTRRALLQNLLFELGLPYRGMEEGELRLSLAEFLRTEARCPDGVLLLVDEAHTLPSRLLEEIRLLTNQVVGERVGFRLVLAGTSRLEERLATAPFDSLNQRIVTRCYLEPLTSEETRNYVRHQLEVAHSRKFPEFHNEALQAVYTATGGVPRLINQLCDHVLVLADANGLESIEPVVIEEAWADLQQLPAPWHMEEPGSPNSQGISTVIEFGELDEPSDEPTSIAAIENELEAEIDLEDSLTGSEQAANSNSASRINPLFVSEDNDLLDNHFATQAESPPVTVPFADVPNDESTSRQEDIPTTLEDSSDASEYSLQLDDSEDFIIHEADPPHAKSKATDFLSDLTEAQQILTDESITDSLQPLPERTCNPFEEIDLDSSSPLLTTDPFAKAIEPEVEPQPLSEYEAHDPLTSVDHTDTELELPEVDDESLAPLKTENCEDVDPPMTDPCELTSRDESFTQESPPVSTTPFAEESKLEVTSPDSSGELESLYGALEPDGEIESDPSFEFVQGVQVNLPLDRSEVDGKTDIDEMFEHTTAEESVASFNAHAPVSPDSQNGETQNGDEAPAVDHPTIETPVATNPFEEAFEEELDVEPLYSSTLDQNRSSLPSSWTSDVNESFDEAVGLLEPVCDDPKEFFPLAINVQEATSETQEEEPGAESAVDPWKYPVLSDAAFETKTPEHTTEEISESEQTDSVHPGLSVLHEESTEQVPREVSPNEEGDSNALHELAASVAEDLDMHAPLEESRYSGQTDAIDSDDDEELDERILREIVSFRDMTSFDPALDPVMPEFRPSMDRGSEDEASDTPPLDGPTIDFDQDRVIDQDLPEIVLVEPVVPTDATADSNDENSTGTDHQSLENENEATGNAHREDYRSLFDRLKGRK